MDRFAEHGVKMPVAARFFALAMFAFVVLAVAAPRAFPLLAASFYARDLLAFVHLNTLGIIGAAIVGASYQVVPCALGVDLRAGRASRASFWMYLAGLIIFLIGFFQSWHPVLATGGTLLAAALTIYVISVTRALRQSQVTDIVSRHIGVSLIGLVGGFSLGFVLAGSKGTWFLGGKTMQVLSAHALLMLAGWVGLMLKGVAYHMVPMLSGSTRRPWSRVALFGLVLGAGGAWLATLALLFTLGRTWVAVGAAAIAINEALFVTQIVRLYLTSEHFRFRRHMPFMMLSSGMGLAASLLLAGGLLSGESLSSRYWIAAGWLAIAGMALTAIQGLFQTIAAELTGAGEEVAPGVDTTLSLAGWFGWTSALLISCRAILDANAGLARTAGFIASFGLVCFLGMVGYTALRWQMAPFRQVRAATMWFVRSG